MLTDAIRVVAPPYSIDSPAPPIHSSPKLQGLEANGLLKGYTHLLTGYIGSPSFLKAVVEVAHKLKVTGARMRV